MDKFYWLVPYSNNDELWIKFLSPLFFISIVIGVLAALVFVNTKTTVGNNKKQNWYWIKIYVLSVILTTIAVWAVKFSVENSNQGNENFSFDLGGTLTAIGISCFYVLLFYYLATGIIRRIPAHNPKRTFPTFVYPKPSKLNSK